jgi:nucleotide-binding universal stress UspA family protein
MSIATVLVLLEGIDADRAVAQTALKLGATFAARVDGLIVRPDPRETVRLAFDGMSPAMIESVMAEVRSESEERVTTARAAFEGACERFEVEIGAAEPAGAGATWTEAVGSAADLVANRGRLADLIVLGRPGHPGAVESFVAAEAALFETGRPVLLVGLAVPERLPGRVAIAWNGSAEAAAAIAGAMPFLSRAEQVVILAIDEAEGEHAGNLPRAGELAGYLARHRIDAETRMPASADRSIGETLLAEVAGLDADLLVMGAYSHSRLRELVLGGVTRHVLAAAEIPILMAR